ncbi:MAG: hypothetical protein WC784_04740 [Candidatus Shapirobacteria bacterium]|jgi:hypothetical protein
MNNFIFRLIRKIKYIVFYFLGNVYFFIFPSKRFVFNGQELKYFRHMYNRAYENERTVEVSIAKWFLNSQTKGVDILEVGDVLNNYGVNFKQDVLDKYEIGSKIINSDVVNFVPEKKYKAIISISTLEHVGWDEAEQNSQKIPQALENLKNNCLLSGGTILVTLPIGYNKFFDEYLSTNPRIFSEKYFFKRISADNLWEQVKYEQVAGVKFGEPFNNANAIFVGVIKKD